MLRDDKLEKKYDIPNHCQNGTSIKCISHFKKSFYRHKRTIPMFLIFLFEILF